MSNGPSNIRINPFVGSGGATTYVNLTETHIIPSVSPFVIRLNEVPEKRDPSNMKCVYVDDTTGAVTSRALTEVAATPAAGQFRPDYSTKADKDDSWNTGLIEFNSADAGKIVQISYTGMGTLAAVQSNKYPSWYTDRGDGSDGDFIPSENTTIGGVKNYKRVFIKEGVTVTVDKQLIFKATDSVVIAGYINALGVSGNGGKNATLGNSYNDGSSGGSGFDSDGDHVYISGHGGAGGNYTSHSGGHGGAGVIGYAATGGGGGGGGGYECVNNGGAGGGGVCVIAPSILIAPNGKINTNGADGIAGAYRKGAGGGGGGGNITLIANTIINNGTITSKGGQSAGSNVGANGANGTITIKQLGVL